MFFNTNKEKGKTLEESKAKAKTQDERVMEVFIDSYIYGETYINADEVLKLSKLNCPITSIRRSITNLTTEGRLIKTELMKMGSYGKQTHCYTINPTHNQVVLF